MIKLYFSYSSHDEVLRYKYLYQWTPIVKNSTRTLKLSNSKPPNAENIFIKYFTETDGVIKEHVIKGELKPGQEEFILTL